MWIGCPGEDEESDGNAPAGDHHGDEARFGWWAAVMFVVERQVVFVDDWGAACGCDDADGERYEHQACDACRVAFALLEDDGEGDEEHVEETVEDGHVEREEEDDGFEEEELEGPNKENGHAFAEGAEVQILLGDVLLASCFFAHFLRSGGEDGWRVCFGNGEGYQNPDDTG